MALSAICLWKYDTFVFAPLIVMFCIDVFAAHEKRHTSVAALRGHGSEASKNTGAEATTGKLCPPQVSKYNVPRVNPLISICPGGLEVELGGQKVHARGSLASIVVEFAETFTR